MEKNKQPPNVMDDQAKDNPALSKVIEKNIRTIIHLRTKAAHERTLEDFIADVITSFSGRMVFAYIHIVWFVAWIFLIPDGSECGLLTHSRMDF